MHKIALCHLFHSFVVWYRFILPISFRSSSIKSTNWISTELITWAEQNKLKHKKRMHILSWFSRCLKTNIYISALNSTDRLWQTRWSWASVLRRNSWQYSSILIHQTCVRTQSVIYHHGLLQMDWGSLPGHQTTRWWVVGILWLGSGIQWAPRHWPPGIVAQWAQWAESPLDLPRNTGVG